MIQVWTINILVMPSRGRTEKSKNGQKHHRTKAPKDQNQGGQNPQKWENILRLQQSRCTIPWSHDTGVDNQHSRHAITWPDREKQKWTKAPQDESPKGSASRRTKPPKMRKYFKTPTIKVYDPKLLDHYMNCDYMLTTLIVWGCCFFCSFIHLRRSRSPQKFNQFCIVPSRPLPDL